MMGTQPGQPGYHDDESQHPVTISHAFCLGTTEVTQGEWQAAMGNNPSYFPSCGSDCPVEQVSWWDALAYCNKRSLDEGLQPCYAMSGCSGTPGTWNASTGIGYYCSGVAFAGVNCSGFRLPTEAEWEYAARAGTTAETYNGTSETIFCEEPNEVLDLIAWWRGNSCTTVPPADCTGSSAGCSTHPVKMKATNDWSLYDMLGSVNEWVWDWYGTYPAAAVDPTGPATGDIRVARGGSWRLNAIFIRAAGRVCGSFPGIHDFDTGLRLAKSMP